jgi:hypothetical protein
MIDTGFSQTHGPAYRNTIADKSSALISLARVLRRQLDDDLDPMSLAYVVARNADKAALARVDSGEAG